MFELTFGWGDPAVLWALALLLALSLAYTLVTR